jgi:hypothetical protein
MKFLWLKRNVHVAKMKFTRRCRVANVHVHEHWPHEHFCSLFSGWSAISVHATTMGKRTPMMDNDKDTDKRRQQHDNYDEYDKDEVGMKKRDKL